MNKDILERRRKKTYVILDMFLRLTCGEVININEVALKENLSYKTINRYIQEVDIYIENMGQKIERRLEVKYNKSKKGYELKNYSKVYLNKEEILFISKSIISENKLLGSEKKQIIKKILTLINESDRNKIYNALFNEINGQENDINNSELMKLVWELSEFALQSNRVIMVLEDREVVIMPLSVIFFEGSQYLIYNKYVDRERDYLDIFVENLVDIKEIIDLRVQESRSNGYLNVKEFNKYFNKGKMCELIRIKMIYYGDNLKRVENIFPSLDISKDGEQYILSGRIFEEGTIEKVLPFGSELKIIEPKYMENKMLGFLDSIYYIFIVQAKLF